MQILPPRFSRQIREAAQLLATGRSRVVLHAMGTRLRSDTIAVGLRRDLTVPHPVPPAKIPLQVRPLESGDDLSMLDISPDTPPDQVPGLVAQRRLLASALPTCWVAIAPNGKVCYMQWLTTSQDNERIHGRWGDLFPILGQDEALLEGAYTGHAYRGQGIMAHAMARIAEGARDFGARWVLTFVGESNVASLKGCAKAGFVRYVRRTESWRLMRRRVRFVPLLPKGSP